MHKLCYNANSQKYIFCPGVKLGDEDNNDINPNIKPSIRLNAL